VEKEDVQLEHGYTRIANELLEAKMRFGFTGRQSQVIDYVERFTYGFQRKTMPLDYGHMSNFTYIAENHCSTVTAGLFVMKVLLPSWESKTRHVGLSKAYSEWKRTPKSGVNSQSGRNPLPSREKSTPKSGVHTIKKVVKETLKEKDPYNPLNPLEAEKAKAKTTSRKTKLPDPFPITPEMAAWFKSKFGFMHRELVGLEHESFIDHWKANGEGKVDWVATWRNWMRRAVEKGYNRALNEIYLRGQKGQQIQDTSNELPDRPVWETPPNGQ